MIVFDISDRNSFDMITTWLQEIEHQTEKGVVKVLVGNKTDLDEHRVVTYEEAIQLSTQHGLKYFETSAKTGQNVKDVFHYLSSHIVHDILQSTLQDKSQSCILAEKDLTTSRR